MNQPARTDDWKRLAELDVEITTTAQSLQGQGTPAWWPAWYGERAGERHQLERRLNRSYGLMGTYVTMEYQYDEVKVAVRDPEGLGEKIRYFEDERAARQVFVQAVAALACLYRDLRRAGWDVRGDSHFLG